MKHALLALLVLVVAPAAWSQRDAVSADLSPEMAANIFQDVVKDVCVPAVTSGGVSALPAAQRGKLQTTNDAEMRRQAGALPDETVWDVMDGKGVVAIREKAGRCVATVYGPPVVATIMSTAKALTPAGFERLASAPPPNGFGQTLYFSSNGRRVMVQLNGSEPGMPGHQSRFSVVTATVFVVP